ncbi:MAG: tetratricopeptide repeat protein [Rhodobacteraceae bacterium]|nr:tetratricopeptide repeat protein [Paracoccaceae bacterium]
MTEDRQNNPLPRATPVAASLFDQAVEAFAGYRGDPVGLFEQAEREAPGMEMARLGRAWLFALATEPAATALARELIADLAAPGDARAASHRAALAEVLAGRWDRGAALLDDHLVVWPRDALAVQAGHIIDFMRADARNLRDRIARVLPFWEGVPGRSFLLGMKAFGLEEAGDYAAALEAGHAALEGDPRDAWAHHAVAHVLEMQGRPDEGRAWMREREAQWAFEENFLKVHNWWHLALCHLELAEPEAALALYDGPVRASRSALAMALLDATSLLWRIQLSGGDVAGRWDELSDMWRAHADGRHYAFNDLHGALAHLGAGREERAEAILSAARAAEGEDEAARWARGITVPLVEGLLAFHRGRAADAIPLLWEGRRRASGFGGSHAQRDIIDWTLTEAALRAGSREAALALAAERLALRPRSPVNRAFLERAEALAA